MESSPVKDLRSIPLYHLRNQPAITVTALQPLLPAIRSTGRVYRLLLLSLPPAQRSEGGMFSVVSVCGFINAITLEPFEVSS